MLQSIGCNNKHSAKKTFTGQKKNCLALATFPNLLSNLSRWRATNYHCQRCLGLRRILLNKSRPHRVNKKIADMNYFRGFLKCVYSYTLQVYMQYHVRKMKSMKCPKEY